MTLSQLEREWFGKRVTDATAQLSLNDLKRRYILGLGVGSAIVPTNSLEKMWLVKIVGDNGGIPASNHISDLLKATLGVLNLPIKNSEQANWTTLYQNYNP